jgi:hypothetical protein
MIQIRRVPVRLLARPPLQYSPACAVVLGAAGATEGKLAPEAQATSEARGCAPGRISAAKMYRAAVARCQPG